MDLAPFRTVQSPDESHFSRRFRVPQKHATLNRKPIGIGVQNAFDSSTVNDFFEELVRKRLILSVIVCRSFCLLTALLSRGGVCAFSVRSI